MTLFAFESDGSARLLFGKYSGYRVHEIPDDYLKWCVEQHVERGSFSEELICEIEEELAFREYHGTNVEGG